MPSEIHDLNTRSAGQSITVFTQLCSGAIVTISFLSMMCTMKYGEPWCSGCCKRYPQPGHHLCKLAAAKVIFHAGVFIFFGVLQFVSFLFVAYFVPETRGVPIEEVTLDPVSLLVNIVHVLHNDAGPLPQRPAPSLPSQHQVCPNSMQHQAFSQRVHVYACLHPTVGSLCMSRLTLPSLHVEHACH